MDNLENGGNCFAGYFSVFRQVGRAAALHTKLTTFLFKHFMSTKLEYDRSCHTFSFSYINDINSFKFI